MSIGDTKVTLELDTDDIMEKLYNTQKKIIVYDLDQIVKKRCPAGISENILEDIADYIIQQNDGIKQKS